MKVYPVPGGEGLRHPPRTNRRIPADGLEVADNDLYWHKRLAHGDVTLDPPKAAALSPPKAPEPAAS